MSGYGDIRPEIQPSGNTIFVTLPESDAAFVHACKGNYRRDPRYDVLRVYQHYYYAQKKPYYFIVQILIGIIYRYRMIENEDQFQRFTADAVFGKWYDSVWSRENDSSLHRLLKACISQIQLWRLHGRSDHYDYNIGEPDTWARRFKA